MRRERRSTTATMMLPFAAPGCATNEWIRIVRSIELRL
jgi:hypothetical protein